MAQVLITGGNRGIGLELARQLSARGDQVIVTCRQRNAELDTLGIRVIEDVDVSSDAGIATLRDAMAGVELDVLVNNAGILTSETLRDLDLDRMRRQYEVNALGPLRVTHALLDNLHAGSKVAILTSRVGSVGDNASGGNYGYRMSKAAVNMAGMNLAIDLRDRGIPVALLHPGLVATEMTGRRGVTPDYAASGLIERIDELTLETTGSFWHAEGEELPW
ncbi:MAG: SDR family oxidoreductase [Gammaproteobacteria bacterium]|nr:SDR family oxidoreductase [Gammaproteobacteria bacterium]